MRRVLLLALATLAAASTTLAAPTVRLEKTDYAPGEDVVVHFDTAGASVHSSGWIGIVPSQIQHGSEAENDKHDLTYQYMGGKVSGTLTFKAPSNPGRYDFRMHDTDGNGKELAHVTFEVKGSDFKGTLTLAKTSYAPGEPIEVAFTASAGLPANAWVGVIPSAVPHGSEPVNDQHDIQYRYLEQKTTGSLKFVAPGTGGSYDLRLNSTDSGGVELASVTFTVSASMSAEVMASTMKSQGKLAVYGIRFASGKADVEPASAEALAAIATMLEADASLKLRIEGHTDNVGTPAANLALSAQRAESVKAHLVAKHGIDAARLATKGLGDTAPIGRNDNEAGRAQNRRVELVRQ